MPTGKLSRDTILQLMLSVEISASHPMAAAICASCKAEGATLIENVEDFMNVKGEGVRAMVRMPKSFGDANEAHTSKLIEIGNARMLKRMHIKFVYAYAYTNYQHSVIDARIHIRFAYAFA